MKTLLERIEEKILLAREQGGHHAGLLDVHSNHEEIEKLKNHFSDLGYSFSYHRCSSTRTYDVYVDF